MRDAEESFRRMFENMGRSTVAATTAESSEIIVANETVPNDHSPYPGLTEMPFG